MSDDRPKPQYGEYATPQDQAKSIAKSQPPVSPLLTPVPAAAPAPPAALAVPAQLPRRRRRWDIILSTALLTYGLLYVISGLFQFSNLSGFIDQVYEVLGVGDFTPTGTEESVGLAINVVNVGLYIATVLLTVGLLRAGRLAFYVPLISGAVATIVSGVLLRAVISGDPAWINFLSSVG